MSWDWSHEVGGGQALFGGHRHKHHSWLLTNVFNGVGASLIAFHKGLARPKRIDLITPGMADLTL